MPFKLSSEQEVMQKVAREYAENKIRPIAAKYDEAEETPLEIIKEMSRLGFSTLTIPEEYGGGGVDALTACLVIEELAWGCAGITTSATANSLAAYPILLFGNEEQKKKYIPPLSNGKLAAFCLTEPGAGSDAGAISTLATPVDKGFILNGNKCFITNGGLADYYTVFATIDRKKGARALSAFIVDRNSPGLSVGKKESKMGIRASNTTEVIFEDVFVPEENLLGKKYGGFRIAMTTLDLSRPIIGALAVGIARAALEKAAQYSKERVQFGKPIGHFQAIQLKLAEMAMRLEAARMLVWRAAILADKKKGRISGASAMAKAYAGDTAMYVTTEALQIMGGYGYMRDYPMEKYMRDAKIMQIYEGTNEIQKMIIAQDVLRSLK